MRSLALFVCALFIFALSASPSRAQAPAPFHSETTDLVIQLPAGWEGAQSVSETTLPARATYRFEATAPGLAGAVVIVERVIGLNPLAQERFRRGQVAFGYHGLRPTALLAGEEMVFGSGAGLAVSGGDRIGRVYFVQRGRVFWAVHLAAPEATLAQTPGLLDTLARGVRLSDREIRPEMVSR